MTALEKQIISEYIFNNLHRLEDDLRQQQGVLRFRKIDAVDCIEYLIALERYNSFRDFSHAILGLLKLTWKNEESGD